MILILNIHVFREKKMINSIHNSPYVNFDDLLYVGMGAILYKLVM